MKHQIAILIAGAFLTGCSAPEDGTTTTHEGVAKADAQPEKKPASEPTTSRPLRNTEIGKLVEIDKADYDMFGAGVAEKGLTLDLASLAANSRKLARKKVRLTGKVESVCKKKGCWMRLTQDPLTQDRVGKSVFVRFTGYAFFMPLDCEGREVVLEGTYSSTETSVADLKHYLEDEGKQAEAAKITEPKLEMKVMADGVAMRKKS